MSFGEAIRTCFGKYVDFSGRASRPEYWFFLLFVILAGFIAGLVDRALFGATITDTASGTVIVVVSRQPVSALVTLVLFLPHFAAAWRRMHDTGRSGFYLLFPSIVGLLAMLVATFGLGLADMASGRLDSVLTGTTLLLMIPLLVLAFLSPLIVFWWLTRPGEPGQNRYGPNPREV